MKKLIGFVCIWVAVGMFLMLLLTSRLLGIVLIGAFSVVGWKLFCDT
ncbi:MAG: hypothetical protein SOY45_05275 [Lachnospiraceae bacterium]|nr:hypothetical protein [Lachnospiraceae bacterium]MDD7146996.1 hypothetical protein [Lachnospiraceae bacterium]MDY4069276.1 hypothetical protein [Lachnospiraceae bacterium]